MWSGTPNTNSAVVCTSTLTPSNAVRHGSPKNVLVSLTWSEGNFSLTISDDGIGFDPKKVSGPPQGHFGLSSMRDRALRVGGTFDIESNPQGTRLSVTVPI